ncbi:MAG: D-alanine--D-alanine ligase [Acetobacteraceae bacterium]|nr:D-alanine--D-alanine ligase [Acetobacteraceae bacterium]
MFYTPVVAHWIALGLRYGDVLLPTAANPRIEAGGLCGESKIAILDQVGPEGRGLIAPYTSVLTSNEDRKADIEAAEAAMAGAGLTYPLIAKPDIGCNGNGVRVLSGRDELVAYLSVFPRGQRVMLQQLVRDEGEAGIFYIRFPDETEGRITSITLKSPPLVIGNGRSTLEQLILADPRAGRVSHLYLPRLADRLREIPAQGVRVPLVFVGNHCKGSIFYDGTGEVTPALTSSIDRIAKAIPEFFFGRFDVRFSSRRALRRGEGFRIIEINGVGSEPTHIWDARTTLREAWRAQFYHYGMAFRIGSANRARGYRPTPVLEVLRLWRLQKRLMAAYPSND